MKQDDLSAEIYEMMILSYRRLNSAEKIKYLALFVNKEYDTLIDTYLVPEVNVLITDNKITIDAKEKIQIEIVKNDLITKGFIIGFPITTYDKKRKLKIANYTLIGIGQQLCLS